MLRCHAPAHGSRISGYQPPRPSGTDDSAFCFSVNGIGKPMAEVAVDADLRGKIEALRVSLKSAGKTAADAIARGAGLAFGFNAMDGD